MLIYISHLVKVKYIRFVSRFSFMLVILHFLLFTFEFLSENK